MLRLQTGLISISLGQILSRSMHLPLTRLDIIDVLNLNSSICANIFDAFFCGMSEGYFLVNGDRNGPSASREMEFLNSVIHTVVALVWMVISHVDSITLIYALLPHLAFKIRVH